MLFGEGALGLVLLALWIFCLIDVITTPESNMRNLPKLAWLFIVLLLFDIGSILWLIAGRNWNGAPRQSAFERRAPAYPEYDRPGRAAASNPDDDDEFLAQVRARAEAQRREYQQRRAAEMEAERNRLTKRPDEDERS